MKAAPILKKQKPEVFTISGTTATIQRHDSGGYESYRVRYYSEGRRKELRAPTREEAKRKMKEALKGVVSGAAHVRTYSPRDSANIEAAISKLAKVGVPLLDAITEYVEARGKLHAGESLIEAAAAFARQRRKKELTPIRIPALVKLFLDDIKARGLSIRYQYDMKARLGVIEKAFAVNVADVTSDEIDDWLGTLKLSNRSRNNYRLSMVTLFSFAQGKYLPRDIKTEAACSRQFKDDSSDEIGIYTPEQIATLLENIGDRMVPFVALGAFAGIRSAEISRLDWSEVRMDEGVIEIKKSKSKVAGRRLVPILPALKAWLEPYYNAAKGKGPVLPGINDFYLATVFKRAINGMTDAKGKRLVEPVTNGLRHSFITYRVADIEDVAKVALEAGNSPDIIFSNYRALATKAQAEKYFGIRPKTSGKVIAFRKSA